MQIRELVNKKQERSFNGENRNYPNKLDTRTHITRKPTVRTTEYKKMTEIFLTDPDSVTHDEFMLFQSVAGYRQAAKLLEDGRRLKRQEAGESPVPTTKTSSLEKEQLKKEGDTDFGSKEAETGIPDNLRFALEKFSGFDLSDIRVYRNSDKPQQIGALAYTKGNKIYIAPGQEKLLPHESWHAVQQKQRRVPPTTQLEGMQVNSDTGLELEADSIGAKLSDRDYSESQAKSSNQNNSKHNKSVRTSDNVIQGVFSINEEVIYREIIDIVSECLKIKNPQLMEQFEDKAYDQKTNYGELYIWLEQNKLTNTEIWPKILNLLASQQLVAARETFDKKEKKSDRPLQAPTMAVGRFNVSGKDVLKTSNQRNLPGTREEAEVYRLKCLAPNSNYPNMHGEMLSVLHYIDQKIEKQPVTLEAIGASQEICLLCQLVLTMLGINYDHEFVSKKIYPRWDDPTGKFSTDRKQMSLTDILKSLGIEKSDAKGRLVILLMGLIKEGEENKKQKAEQLADSILTGNLQGFSERSELISTLKKLCEVPATTKRVRSGSAGKLRTKKARREHRLLLQARRKEKEKNKNESEMETNKVTKKEDTVEGDSIKEETMEVSKQIESESVQQSTVTEKHKQMQAATNVYEGENNSDDPDR